VVAEALSFTDERLAPAEYHDGLTVAKTFSPSKELRSFIRRLNR
jgi:hypothetical protein